MWLIPYFSFNSILILLPLLLLIVGAPCVWAAESSREAAKIVLPKPALDGAVSVEKALNERRSLREYSSAPLDLNQLSQLLWAAGGISSKRGLRTAPSAGALYPLEFYAAAGNVKDLAAGLYKYDIAGHALVKVSEGDKRDALYSSCLGQAAVKNAPLVIIIAADYKRTSVKYGARAERFVHMEAGHASQNICLQTVSLKAATVPVGAFDDAAVKKVLGLPDNEEPLYIMPIGIK